MRRAWVFGLAVVVCLVVGQVAMAEEPELDPLLELLVEQGVITPEQARAVQAEYDRREGKAVENAVGWIAEHFSVERNPEANFRLGEMDGTVREVTDSFWRHYWLWSLERAATLAKVDRFGDHDWYGEVSQHLLNETPLAGST